MTLYDQVLDDIIETHEQLSRCRSARNYAKPHLDQGDDDYEFVEASLERWGDRSFKFHKWS